MEVIRDVVRGSLEETPRFEAKSPVCRSSTCEGVQCPPHRVLSQVSVDTWRSA